jgi:hypothetical protein
MAISATFAADFSAFNAAVAQADAKIKSFETDVSKVGRTLDRFANEFSGKKIIQDATLMQRAIEEVGGVSKLTAAEMQRAGRVFEEAFAKMRAMGIDIPPKMQAAAASINYVEQEVKELANASQTASQKMSLIDRAGAAMKGTFGQVFSAFTAANLVDKAVGSIINFGKAALDNAGYLSDMSKATGVGVEELQRMQHVAEQTGSTLETYTGAAAKLGISIAGGTTKARDAVKLLKLSYDDLAASDPGAQFAKVMAAAGKLTTEQRNLALSALFGKGAYLELAAAGGDTYASLAKDAAVSTDEQIAELDELGDAWAAFQREVSTGFASMMGAAILKAKELDDFVTQQANELRALFGAAALPPRALLQGQQLKGPYADPKKALEGVDKPGGKKPPPLDPGAAAAREKAAAAQERFNAQIRQGINLVEEMRLAEQGAAIARGTLADETAAYLAKTGQAAPSLDKFAQTMSALPNAAKVLGLGLLPATKNVEAMTLAMQANTVVQTQWMHSANDSAKVASGLGAGLSSGWKSMVSNLTGGGGWSGFGANMGNQIVKGFEQMVSGGISSLIGAGVGLATKGIQALGSKLFKTEGKQTNKARDAWIRENYGSQAELAKLAKAAGVTDKELQRLFTIGRVKDFEAMAAKVKERIDDMADATEKAARDAEELADARADWIKGFAGGEEAFRRLARQAGLTEEQIRKVFDPANLDEFNEATREAQAQLDRFAREQEEDAERLDKAIEKYGFAWDELGKQVQQSKLDEQAKDLIEDWRVLIKAGVDLNKVNAKMSDHIEDYLELAKKTGAEVPAAMRPILQKMIESGVLTDEAGKKIERLEDLGVNFAETMTEGFDRVVEKLDELINKLFGVADAINDIPDQKEIDIIVNRSEHVTDDSDEEEDHPAVDDTLEYPGGAPESYLAPMNFNKGTGGRFLDFGEGTPAMLHGHERVVTGAEARAENADVAAMVTAVQGLQTVLLRAVRENALQMRDQVLLARA